MLRRSPLAVNAYEKKRRKKKKKRRKKGKRKKEKGKRKKERKKKKKKRNKRSSPGDDDRGTNQCFEFGQFITSSSKSRWITFGKRQLLCNRNLRKLAELAGLVGLIGPEWS